MGPRIATHRATNLAPFRPSRRVLVVEDQPQDRNYLSSVLQGRGFEVCACASVEEGARCLEQWRFDFVVVCQGSRAFEGRSILERVLDIDRGIPVLVLTRCADMACYLEAMQLGAVDYLEKPLSPSEIIRVVETHLRPQSTAA